MESAELGANKEKIDYMFKFIIIGDTGVGKSCLLN
jgi:GTPase SAR1 family protein